MYDCGCGCVSHPHLALAGAEVEVEAAFEALLDEAREGRHGAQAGELLGQELQLPVLWVLLLPGKTLRGTTSQLGSVTVCFQAGRRKEVE